jgi:hypothetical protein
MGEPDVARPGPEDLAREGLELRRVLAPPQGRGDGGASRDEQQVSDAGQDDECADGSSFRAKGIACPAGIKLQGSAGLPYTPPVILVTAPLRLASLAQGNAPWDLRA